MVPCSCRVQQVRQNQVKRASTTMEGLFPWMPVGVRNILAEGYAIMTTIIPPRITPEDALKSDNRECPVCGGKGEIEDFTDSTEEWNQAVQAAEQNKDKLLELEQKVGPVGGNEYKRVIGNSLVEIGMSFNDSPSYEVLPDKGYAPSGNFVTSQGVVPGHTKTNIVKGINVLPTIGGQGVFKCANKLTFVTGAQGIEMDSVGPLTMNAGITRITAPEISLGSNQGPVTIEGNSVAIAGKSITLSPTPEGGGQVTVQGTLGTSGNLITQGGAHIEGDLSFISASCPMKLDRTRFSATIDQVTGNAVWSQECLPQAIQDFIRKWQVLLTDPSMYPFSPRGAIAFSADVAALVKKALPIELIQTGIAIDPNSGIIPVYNFPHHHVMPDGVHTHDIQVPNIRLCESAEEVRKTAGAKESPAPVGAQKPQGSILEFLRSAFTWVTGLISR